MPNEFVQMPLSMLLLFCLVPNQDTMQPSPPSLDLKTLKNFVTEADVIVVGNIGKIKEIDSVNGIGVRKISEVILNIEKLLKGNILGKTILIKETYPSFDSPKPDPGQKVQGPPKTTIGLSGFIFSHAHKKALELLVSIILSSLHSFSSGKNRKQYQVNVKMDIEYEAPISSSYNNTGLFVCL